MLVFYVYILFDWLGIPRYVGKGSGNRDIIHESTTDTINLLKNEFIEQTWIMLEEVPKIRIAENLSEEKAFELEILLITTLGRLDLGTGPLTNMTNGGEGRSGYKFSAYTRRLLSEAAIIQNNSFTPEERSNRVREAHKRRTPEERSNISSKGHQKRNRSSYNKSLAAMQRANAALSDEERTARGRKGVATKTSEQLSRWATEFQARRTPEERSLSACKSAAAQTKEQRSEKSKKANTSRSPKQRREIAFKVWVTRRTNQNNSEVPIE